MTGTSNNSEPEPLDPGYVAVWMIHRDLARAPRHELPRGYAFRFFREGDIATWMRVQQAAIPEFTVTEKMFHDDMPGDTALWSQRVLFLVGPEGDDIGSITAWHAEEPPGVLVGQVHWVAIVPAAQGRGLGKPLMSAALALMRERGLNQAVLQTETGLFPALNLYLRFGFEPLLRGAADRDGWLAVAPLLRYPVAVGPASA